MNIKKKYKQLRLILGDQLNIKHSWFKAPDSDVLYLIAELKQEAVYVKHHIQKLCAFFLAMENFATALKAKGHDVLYLSLDDTAQYEDMAHLIQSLAVRYSVSEVNFQRPDEYRLSNQLGALKFTKPIKVRVFDSEHFLLPFEETHRLIKSGQHNRMETFYRKMRKRFDILMDNGQPLGEKWNYDSENRAKLKKEDMQSIPEPKLFSYDVTPILKRIERHRIPHFGQCAEALLWPTSRADSLKLLRHFCDQCLPLFGRFQDAMTGQHPYQWTLYHSRLSYSLNSKMLHPKEVIDAAVKVFNKSNHISLAQIEGFVRQILGWREYIRCVYWVNMPRYQKRNQLAARRDLPSFFWHGDTKMNCMKQAISQSLAYAYAHHIQRLMITGNFCLLAGIDPDQVDNWYLGIYIDAIEWVEMPNTRGMSQFADGGWVATKPYSAGGNYINKMSDYCKQCHYTVKEKVTKEACPFNSLYWYFMNKHRDKFENNPRIGMVYRSWEKQTIEVQQATLARAKWCLENVEDL